MTTFIGSHFEGCTFAQRKPKTRRWLLEVWALETLQRPGHAVATGVGAGYLLSEAAEQVLQEQGVEVDDTFWMRHIVSDNVELNEAE